MGKWPGHQSGTDAIDDVQAKVNAHGGKIIAERHSDEPGRSFYIATFRDPAGNLIGLYQEATRECLNPWHPMSSEGGVEDRGHPLCGRVCYGAGASLE